MSNKEKDDIAKVGPISDAIRELGKQIRSDAIEESIRLNSKTRNMNFVEALRTGKWISHEFVDMDFMYDYSNRMLFMNNDKNYFTARANGNVILPLIMRYLISDGWFVRAYNK
jgi:hypothetical protein